MQKHFITAQYGRASLCGLFLLIFSGKLMASEPLSLTKALQNSLKHHPKLQAYPYEMRVQEAKAIQAKLRPNPSLDVELENVFGTGNNQGVDSAQLTLSLSQLIELGDKQQHRVALQQQKKATIHSQYQSDRLRVLTDTATKFYQVLYQQQLIKWNQQRAVRTRQLLNTIKQRAKAGAVSNADVSHIAYRLAEIELVDVQLQGELSSARYQLGQMWLMTPDFEQVIGNSHQLPKLPDETSWQRAVNRAPDFILLAHQVQVQQAKLALAKANGVADITLGVGLQHNAQTNDSGFALDFSMPLNWQTPNKGNIAAANAQMKTLTMQQALLRQSLRNNVARLHATMRINSNVIEQLQQRLLPKAEQLVQDSQNSYQKGQISVLQLLEAQQALFDAQRQLLTMRIEQFQALVNMQRLTGQSLLEHSGND